MVFSIDLNRSFYGSEPVTTATWIRCTSYRQIPRHDEISSERMYHTNLIFTLCITMKWHIFCNKEYILFLFLFTVWTEACKSNAIILDVSTVLMKTLIKKVIPTEVWFKSLQKKMCVRFNNVSFILHYCIWSCTLIHFWVALKHVDISGAQRLALSVFLGPEQNKVKQKLALLCSSALEQTPRKHETGRNCCFR